jgi:hypothetical protein
MVPVFGLIGAVVGAVFEGILLLFGGVFAEYVDVRRKRKAEATNRPLVERKSIIPRKVVHWVAGTCSLVGVLGIAASYVFFQPILRYVMDVASEKAGMSVVYAQASGSLLGGHVVLEGLELSRVHETGLAFDLEIERAEADVSLVSLIGGTPILILGKVDGTTGTITPPLPKEEKKGLPKRPRPFQAELFAIENVDLQITPRGEEPFSVLVESAQMAPFRSRLAVFDLLFRSNMTAEIAGRLLIVDTKKITENGRETHWKFEDIDAAQLKRILPKAPLTWVDDGRITVTVSDKWSLSDDFIEMDWRIATTSMRTSVPEEAGIAERTLAAGLRKYVEKFGGDVDFQYRLELAPEEMAQLRDGNLDLFWQKVLSGIVRGDVVQSEAQNATEEAVDEDGPKVIERLKSIFKRDPAAD